MSSTSQRINDRSVASELDKLSWLILQCLVDSDEERLTTTDLKMRTGIEENQRILYRVREHLEDGDLVATQQPEPNGPGTIPSKQICVTERGERVFSEFSPEIVDTDEDRLEMLELRMTQIEIQQEEILESLDRIEKELDMEDKTDLPSINQMQRGFRAIYDYLEDAEDANLFAYMPDKER